MNRNEKILKHIRKEGCGIEIGASFNPVAPKREGYQVEVIDHLSRQELIAKYKDHNVNVNNIEEVDYVWQGGSYSDLIQRNSHYDWIIASHVIEHTPDLIGFLNDCAQLLKDDGVLSLVIPDKRYCFDHFRPLSGISKIIDNHIHKNKIHTAGTVAEYFLNVVSQSGQIAWGQGIKGEYNFVHTLDNAIGGMHAVTTKEEYLDVHAWCFVPHSFRLLIHDLCSLNLISLKEMSFYPTEGCEFYITLSKNGAGLERSRIEVLEIIERESAEELASSMSERGESENFAVAEVENPNSFLKRFIKRFI